MAAVFETAPSFAARLRTLLITALCATLLLAGCAATPSLKIPASEPLGEHTPSETIERFFDAMAAGDTATLSEIVVDQKGSGDTLVHLPAQVPELLSVSAEVDERPRDVDYKFATAEVRVRVGDAEYDWQLRLNFNMGDNPRWQIVNAYLEVYSGSIGTYPLNTKPSGESFAPSLPSTVMTTESPDPGLEASYTGLLIGGHNLTAMHESGFLSAKLDGAPILVEPPSAESRAQYDDGQEFLEEVETREASAKYTVDDAGKAAVTEELERIAEKCNEWCEEPSDAMYFGRAYWGANSSMQQDQRAVKFDASSFANAKFTVIRGDDPAWQSQLKGSYSRTSSDTLYIEVSEIKASTTTTQCDGNECQPSPEESPHDKVKILFYVFSDDVSAEAMQGLD